MGHPDQHELPFDIRHTRWPILFDCPEDAPTEVRRRARDALTKQLTAALKAIFGGEVARAAIDLSANRHVIALSRGPSLSAKKLAAKEQ